MQLGERLAAQATQRAASNALNERQVRSPCAVMSRQMERYMILIQQSMHESFRLLKEVIRHQCE